MIHFRRQRSLVAALAAVLASAEKSATPLFDIDLSTLTKPPLWEPTLEEYFPVQSGAAEVDEQGLKSPVVIENPTNEEFVHHARKGYPVLVSDWAKGMQYEGWSGKDFADKFPFGYMKAEYIDQMPGFKNKDHDHKRIDGELRFNIGSFKPDKKTMWHNCTRPASKQYADDPQKPETGPYVWHVKDELTPPQKKLVQAKFEAPKFLQDQLNKDWMNRSFELWFSPGKGAGAGAHNDGYCESVVSVQLRGEKKWRNMMEPEMTFLDSYDEFDGGVYKADKWKPDLGFVLKTGSAVIWPPGYLHETRTLEPADGACGAAITLQYAFPQPVQFFRAFLPRLSMSAEISHCLPNTWSSYATMYTEGINPTPKQDKMKAQKETILAKIDANKDGEITVEEVKKYFQSGKASRHLQERAYGIQDLELFYQFLAEDTVAYHDMNNDMVVSTQELWDSLVQWNVVRVRMSKGLGFMNTADKKGIEEFERSLDYMRRTPAVFPKKMRPELDGIFSLKKGTKLYPKTPRSYSDSDFFSELHGRLQQLGARSEL
jgi:hypothetical protein